MKTTKIFMMAALALMMTACSNDDNDQTAPKPNADGEITVTATIDVNDGSALTRAVADNGTTITSGLAVDEQIAVLFSDGTDNLKRTATVKSITAGTATIEFTIPSTLADGTACTLVYPATAANAANTDVDTYANLLAAQTGTLGANLDVRKGTATILNDGETASLSGTPSLAAQFAIHKFTIQDLSAADKTATEFKVSDASGNVIATVTPGSATGTLYVALPVMAAGTYWFNATIDSKPYIAKATTAAATVAGKYYQTTVKMATIGDVILSDGKFAAPSSTGTKVAMIAYLGNGSDCTNGLAIQLNASPASMSWSDACNYSSYPSITGNPGTWRLPSKDDWQNMFVGCAKDGDDSDASDNSLDPIAGFKEKIGATGITWKSDGYWSSTDSASGAWCVYVSLRGRSSNADFYDFGTFSPYGVLGCLAF